MADFEELKQRLAKTAQEVEPTFKKNAAAIEERRARQAAIDKAARDGRLRDLWNAMVKAADETVQAIRDQPWLSNYSKHDVYPADNNNQTPGVTLVLGPTADYDGESSVSLHCTGIYTSDPRGEISLLMRKNDSTQVRVAETRIDLLNSKESDLAEWTKNAFAQGVEKYLRLRAEASPHRR